MNDLQDDDRSPDLAVLAAILVAQVAALRLVSKRLDAKLTALEQRLDALESRTR